MEKQKHILILGGGISGVCTAYYLRQLGGPTLSITIVDSEGTIAACASGKAGGFFARDWPQSELSRNSFELHKDLATKYNGHTRWLYREVSTYSVHIPLSKQQPKTASPVSKEEQDWTAAAKSKELIGSPHNTAQVHPRLFCEALFELSGARLVHARVIDLLREGDNVSGVSVELEGNGCENITASEVVIALGPWSETIAREKWGLGIRRVDSQCGHSIVLKPDESVAPIPAECLFTEVGKMEGPEVYPRSDGTVYMCGGGGMYTEPLPALPGQVKPLENITNHLVDLSKKICPSTLDGAEVLAKQACFLPSSYGGPMIGRVAPYDNLYIGTANSVWGIMNGPSTGLALAELILYGESKSLDISEFNPME
ncbi:hypothetical protein HDU79_004739 [Rhizoclosmatium sp. JEL0117]|nr:hypothetical protein HDU79_004739 [Rhizoclosmatium sp. JEL0117]